jgi:NitT/TauT family transport system substrate-binding protein
MRAPTRAPAQICWSLGKVRAYSRQNEIREDTMRRRDFCRSLAATPFVLAAPAIRRSALAQEAASITLVKQHGLPYLPLMVMEELRLVESHGARQGLPSLKPRYSTLGGTVSLIDALLAGQMNFGVTGAPALVTLWAKTAGTPNEVRALSAVQSMPFYLVTHKENVKSIRDFTSQDKIALPAVKVSSQALCLQMAAAKEWGFENYAKLDPITITRAHPDAATAIMSKSSEITGHYAVAPFYYFELATPGVHSVLKSYDTFGGSVTNGVMLMTKAFREANPKVTAAVYGALEEAEAFVTKNPRQAGEIYIKMTNEKRSSAADMEKIVADPDNVWTTTPARAMEFATFMNKVGSVKRQPSAWTDMFMPEAHALKGT